MIYQHVPEMCKECAKATRAGSISLAKGEQYLNIRQYSKEEKAMIAKFKREA